MWWNWQTRLAKDQVLIRAGSSPVIGTSQIVGIMTLTQPSKRPIPQILQNALGAVGQRFEPSSLRQYGEIAQQVRATYFIGLVYGGVAQLVKCDCFMRSRSQVQILSPSPIFHQPNWQRQYAQAVFSFSSNLRWKTILRPLQRNFFLKELPVKPCVEGSNPSSGYCLEQLKWQSDDIFKERSC